MKRFPQLNQTDLMDAYGTYLTMVCIILKSRVSEWYLIAEHKDMYDAKTVDIVFNNFYVDDCLVSVPTDSEAVLVYQKLTEMCAKGGF